MKNEWNIFLKSFGAKSSFLFVIVYDLLFYIITVPCFLIYRYIQGEKITTLNVGDLQAYISTASSAQMQALTSSMKSFIYFIVIGAVLLLLITLFSYSFSRTLIWNYLLKKKFNTKKFLRFSLLNLFLGIIVFAGMIIYMLLIRISPLVFMILFYLVFIAVLFFISLLYINYTKTGKIFKSLSLAFESINKKIGIAYLFSAGVFAIILLLIFLLNLVIRVPSLSSIISLLILIIFTAWMRLYILSIIK